VRVGGGGGGGGGGCCSFFGDLFLFFPFLFSDKLSDIMFLK
jgi:hypothetical protein